MAAFQSISNILGKFSPSQRLTALILVLVAIVGISFFQFVGESKPECETLQDQLVQTQSQLTSTISSQSTFIQTIDDLRKKTFDLNGEISRRDSIIFALTNRRNTLEKQLSLVAVVDNFVVEPLRMIVEPETEPVLAARIDYPLLNNHPRYEDTLQINYPSPAPDSITISSYQDTTITATIDTSLSKGKVPWIRRILGRKN
jgi:hypothetical protein